MIFRLLVGDREIRHFTWDLGDGHKASTLESSKFLLREDEGSDNIVYICEFFLL